MPGGLKWYYKAAVYQVCDPKRQTRAGQKSHQKTITVKGGSFSKRGHLETSDSKCCQAPKNKPSVGAGGVGGRLSARLKEKCVQTCWVLPPTRPLLPDNTRPDRSLQVAGCQPPECALTPARARTHTRTGTLTPCAPARIKTSWSLEKPWSRSGAPGWSGNI